jgi:hypothetical protein
MSPNEFTPLKDGDIIGVGKFRSPVSVAFEQTFDVSKLFVRERITVIGILSIMSLVFFYSIEGAIKIDQLGLVFGGLLWLFFLKAVFEQWIYQVSQSRAIRNLKMVYFDGYVVITDMRVNLTLEMIHNQIQKGFVASSKVEMSINSSITSFFKKGDSVDWNFDFLNTSIDSSLIGDWGGKGIDRSVEDVYFQVHPRFKGYTKSNQLIQFIRSQGDIAMFWMP